MIPNGWILQQMNISGKLVQVYEEYLSYSQGEANKSAILYDTKKIDSNLPPVLWKNTDSK